MKPIDVIALTFGLLWAIVTFILIRRNKSNPKTWARIFGIGIGVYIFVSAVTASILLRPLSEFVDNLIINLFLSLVAGTVGYISGRMLARRRENKK